MRYQNPPMLFGSNRPMGDISSTLSANGPILLTLALGVGLAWWGMHRANKRSSALGTVERTPELR